MIAQMQATRRQKAYREYLKTTHWKHLRKAAIERDGGHCVRCPSDDRLQVHHLIYRGKPEDTLLSDLETLCRKCHRLTHGFGPTDFESQCREIEKSFNQLKRPPVSAWKKLKALRCGSDDEIIAFGELMFAFVNLIISHERNGAADDWWMDKTKARFWWQRAYNVRESIFNRIT
jgi:hypothetical protein